MAGMYKNWLQCIKNPYAIAKEWMDKDEALWVESKLGLDLNSELESISLINMTHPSLEEALDEMNPGATNPRKILHNHEGTSLELEKEDDIYEHGSYFMNTSSNPCSHEKFYEFW